MSNLQTPARSGNPSPVSRTSPLSPAAVAETAADDWAAFQLVARYPGLVHKSDSFLIELIADPPAFMGDADEVSTVAAILLAARLDGKLPRVA